ncbi:aldo/keto reductase [Dysgonomonas sp. 521]|uniref:aldo/keto reductase n=1 Tax=Dysgonomonas sp. 521 TaxID=2302932 RepID=UPI0013D15022|nr:aldo/keto reductase [Dysgonomonas sp. 521]NDV94495.1 aldo/keto reductase [Dysgonomonas sp. 521]
MKKDDINRRNFLKTLGAGSIVTTAAMYGCKPNNTVSAEGNAIGDIPTDKMTYRTNHITGDVVSLLGYGCMRWPLRTNSNGEEEVDQDAVNELVDYAIAHGVNYFDTAPVYVRGWSEKATGIALKRHPRDSYFIATKMSNHRMADLGLSNEEYYKRSVEMYHNSFKELQVDYLDYYLLHSVGAGDGIPLFNKRFIDNGVLDFMLKEREAGRIRNLGFSFHGDVAVYDHLLNMDIKWDFVQIQLNYQDWKHATGRNVNAEYLHGELVKRNIPAIIMEPLLGGRLARVPAQAQEVMREMHSGDSAAKWAFRYAGTPELVLTVLSGMVYMEHLQENIRTYSPLQLLNETEYEALAEVTDIMMNSEFIQCTDCQYCMPCPYGLNIPKVFGHYNHIISTGYRLKSSKDENYKKARKAFLIGYDRSVPKLRQASHCINCGICKPHCPQSIDIPNEMRRIDLYAEQLKQKIEF